MKNFHFALIALLLFSTACLGQSPAAPPTFDLPPDFYPILSWDLPHWSSDHFSDPRHGLASLDQCAFNTAAFVRPQHLQECEKLGLKCILAAQNFPIPWRKMSDSDIEATVKKLVDDAGNSPAVIGYFLADEPGMPDFEALGKAVAAVKKFAPGKLAYINLFPDYATLGAPDLSQLGTANYTEYLEQYVKIIHPQFISYDNYRIEFSDDQKNAAVAVSYYGNLMEVRRVAMEHGVPFWNIVSSNRLRPDCTIPSPANLALQAYTTLASGAQALTWYTYYSTGYLYAPVDAAGRKTGTWAYLKSVNEQIKVLGPILSRLKSTGVYFTAPLPAPMLAKLPGSVVENATSAVPLMVGEFAKPDNSNDCYAMIVNLSLRESATFTITPHGAATVQQISSVDGSLQPLEPGNTATLPAGNGILLKFTRSGG